MSVQSCFAPWCGIDGKYANPGVCNAPGGHRYKPPSPPLTVMAAHLAADCPDRATCWAKDIHDAHSEPEPTETAMSPHSRACGIHPHPHGARCSPDCPTCGGRDDAAPSSGWLDPPNPRHSCHAEMPAPTREDWQRRWRCSCGKVYIVQDSQRDGFYFEAVKSD